MLETTRTRWTTAETRERELMLARVESKLPFLSITSTPRFLSTKSYPQVVTALGLSSCSSFVCRGIRGRLWWRRGRGDRPQVSG